MRQLKNADELEQAITTNGALIFKHSTRCPISAAADRHMAKLVAERPDAPIFIVDVNAQRALSQKVAERSGVEHHSPQAILFRDGRSAWSASHYDITAKALRAALDGGGPPARESAPTGTGPTALGDPSPEGSTR